MRSILALSLLLIAAPAAGQADQAARTVEVRLSNFDFAPQQIHLSGGQPVVLRLVNTSNGGHNFAAPEFFAAATLGAGAAAHIERGRVEVGRGQSVDLRLVPARGHYALRCTHTMHTMFGMRGEIVVD